MSGKFKRGSYGGGRGSFKKGFTSKKRSSPDEDDTTRTFKRAKAEEEDDDDDEEGQPYVPELHEDGDGNSYIPLKANDLRRVTISEFKGKTFVNIREYWKNDADETLPGKKGIMLTVDQYNAFVAGLPLLETILEKQGLKTVRPNYDDDNGAAEDDTGSGDEEDEEERPAKGKSNYEAENDDDDDE